MAVRFYMNVQVPLAVTLQLRRREVDALTAQDDDRAESEDHELLERANVLGRLVFTQDIRFKALAYDWVRAGRPFAGLVFGHQLRGTIGQFVRDLDLISKASDAGEWLNTVDEIPFT